MMAFQLQAADLQTSLQPYLFGIANAKSYATRKDYVHQDFCLPQLSVPAQCGSFL